MDEALIRIITEEVLAALAARGITVRKDAGGCGVSCTGKSEAVLSEMRQSVCEERLITEAIAKSLCKGGIREVCILKNALVTPSAWDIFKENKVKVNRNE